MLPRAIARAAAIALFGFTIWTTQVLAAEGEPAPAGKAAPADKGTPAAVPAAADTKPTAQKDASSEDCGKALDKFAAGDATALDSLNEQRRQELMTHSAAEGAVTCLAVAEKNEKLCDLLPKPQKDGCAHQFKMFDSLRGASKEAFKAQAIFEACSRGGNIPACTIMRDAITSHDAGKCNGLPKIASADSPKAEIEKYVALCSALATSDASKCKVISDDTEQRNCAAYASNDPERCPKEAGDCRNIVNAFSIVAKKGLAGLSEIDASAVAAVEGRKACAATSAELKKGCGAR
jgi:hypothetical protein